MLRNDITFPKVLKRVCVSAVLALQKEQKILLHNDFIFPKSAEKKFALVTRENYNIFFAQNLR